MSREWSQVYVFDCGSDHDQMKPCPGHTLRLEVCRSSDTVCIEVDSGKKTYTMSDGEYDALDKAMDELRLRWAR